VKIVYTKGGGKKPTHNYATSCDNINDLSRFVVQLYARYGTMLTPLICKPANYFREAPSILHLHAEHFVASLDTLCHNPVHPGPKLSHNLTLLIPSEALTQLLDKVMPFYSEIVKSVNTLVKLAASQNKRTLEEVDEGGEDDLEDNRPKKKSRNN
jgi:hypothetical protein